MPVDLARCLKTSKNELEFRTVVVAVKPGLQG